MIEALLKFSREAAGTTKPPMFLSSVLACLEKKVKHCAPTTVLIRQVAHMGNNLSNAVAS